MKTRFILRFIHLSLTLIFISNTLISANRYWVGTGAGNWNNIANWSTSSGGLSGASIPTAADIAIFDGGNTSSCIIDVNVNVIGFSITALYTGTVSVNLGIIITTAASGFSQSGGTFIGNNGNITINGSFSLMGGVFTSTTGILQISSGYTFSGGTFNHNNGTVSFSVAQTISGNTSFYTILFVASGGVYTIASGTMLTSINNVIISGGASCTINTGTVEIQGNLTLTSSSNNTVNGGTAIFLFDGVGVQNINSALGAINVGTNERMCALPNVQINKTSGSLNLNGLININGTSWNTLAGAALINAGTSTINIISSITFSGQNLSLYNMHIWSNSQIITLSPATYTLTSTNNVTINGGGYYLLNTGVLEILGDLTLLSTNTSALNGGTGTMLFDGSGTQNINSSAASLNYVCALPGVQINKVSGALNLNGIINFNGSSWNTTAGASLINAGTSTINVLKTSTLSGQNLSLYDIVVTGNFSTITISSGTMWTSTDMLTLAGGSSWYQINTGTLNAKGNVLVTNTNTSNNVGGNAVLLFDGNANQLLTGSGISGGGRLPQVQINKTGGTLTLASIISTDNNWTYIAGNVDASTNTSTVDFYKTSVINGQGTSATMSFFNTIFSGFISLGGNMNVNGNFTIRSGVNNRLDVTSANNYQLNVAGNWTNNNSATASSFNQQSGTVVFNGGAAQTLALDIATNNETFYNLQINNSSGGLTLSAPVIISNNINFISGDIISSAANILLLTNAVTATGASNGSFVAGPVCKTGNQAFIFPTGKNAVYAPIAISAPSVNTNQFTAEYFEADPDPLYSTSLKDATLDHLSRCEYWELDRTTGTSNVSVTLSWDTLRSCGLSNLNTLHVARWNGSLWNDLGNGGTTGTTVDGTIISSAVVTLFGPFTLASTTTANPLPIELINFTGIPVDNIVNLFWTTSVEINNDYFTIEKSNDGITFTKLIDVKGADNTNTYKNYTATDRQPYSGISYYRLKQTDYNNNSKYFNVVSVNYNVLQTITIYPNPLEGTACLHVEISGYQNQEVVIVLKDMQGREFLSKVLSVTENNQVFIIYETKDLAPGTYIISASSFDKIYNYKFIIQ